MKRKKGVWLSVSLLVFSSFLTGCYDKVELEEQAFVLAMGFDKGPDDTLDVTVRTAVPTKLSGGSSGGGGGGGGSDLGLSGSKPVTVRAHSLPEAMNLLNTNIERRLSLLQCNVIVFGQDLAKDGIIEELRALSRYHEFRQTTYMQLAKGKASEVLSSEKPVYEATDIRFAEDLAKIGRLTGFLPRSTLHDFLNNLAAFGEDPFLPILSVNQKVKKSEEQEKAKEKGGGGDKGNRLQGGEEAAKEEKEGSKLQGNEPKYNAGEVIRLGGNPVEFMGTAVFRGDKMVTTLDGVQTRMLLALRGELERAQIEIQSPFNKSKYVGVEIKRISTPKISYNLSASPIQIRIEEDMEGELYGDQAGSDYTKDENIQALEQQVNSSMGRVQEKMVGEILHKYQADPFGIFRGARGQFLTNQDLQNYGWREKVKEADVEVKVDFKLRRTGLQLTPVPDGRQDYTYRNARQQKRNS